METMVIRVSCIGCGKQTVVIGYEIELPEELLSSFYSKGGCCSVCRSCMLGIVG